MPIYEYRCDNCGHELEAFQKLSEDKLVNCPECKMDTLIKKVSAAGFRLKGGGWYETDFKSGKKKNVSGAESADKKGSDSSSSSSGDSAGGSGSKSSESTTTSTSSTKSSDSSASSA